MSKVISTFSNGVPKLTDVDYSIELPKYQETNPEEISKMYQRLTDTFKSGKTRTKAFRIQQLRNLAQTIKLRYSMLITAMVTDFKVFADSVLEVNTALQEIAEYLEHFDKWTQPTKVETSLANAMDTAKVIYEPYGLWLNIAPWNFPTVLTLTPLIGAIAAGNCCVIKPSELAPNSAAALTLVLEEALDSSAFAVINGDKDNTTKLLELKWDYILYTGNSTVARIVMAAAAKHLTPVGLELGGKSPAIIDEKTADLRIAARRIIWGKMMNAGQICITVDYVIIAPSIKEKFIEMLKEEIVKFYSKDTKDNPLWSRIVIPRHAERIVKLLPTPDSPKSHGTIVYGGNYDIEKRYIEPTIVTDLDVNEAPLMQGEIFGPVLPVIEMPSLEDSIQYLQSRDKPLALYIFSDDQNYIDRAMTSISSGGVCINDVISHFLVNNLPFGGVGESGMGSYHGPNSVREFSHKRSVLHSPSYRSLEPLLSLRYPPVALDAALPLNFPSLTYPLEPSESFFTKMVNGFASTWKFVMSSLYLTITGRPDGKKF